METTKTLDSLILMVGLSQQDEPTIYVVCPRTHMWQSAPVVWGSLGTERIEVYELSLAAKPLKTILMGDTEEGATDEIFHQGSMGSLPINPLYFGK